MPGPRSLLTILAAVQILLAPASGPSAVAWGGEGTGQARLLFTGDILLSRQVKEELARTGKTPWEAFGPLFREADWVVGNLEGAVGRPEDCLTSTAGGPCFDIPVGVIRLLGQAGFAALGIENNHGADLGEKGREATRRALIEENLTALSFDGSPAFLRFHDVVVGVVSLSAVPGKDGKKVEIPSDDLRRKMRLARRLANAVVVFVHWGSELLDWPDASQRRGADWLVRNGADLVVGHHPHVVQAPECMHGKPVIYSLGNHVFDQKYPATKKGLLADCTVSEEELNCTAIATSTGRGTSFPIPAGAGKDDGTAAVPAPCISKLPRPITVNGTTLRPVFGNAVDVRSSGHCRLLPFEGGESKATASASAGVGDGGTGHDTIVLEAIANGKTIWKSSPLRLVSLDAGKLGCPESPELLFTLERHPSPMDKEDGIRPYVYEIGPRGLIPRWRGTSLAWPLIDAALLPPDKTTLCALHRGDSFIAPEPGTGSRRVLAYRWNGFGFSGIDDPALAAACRDLF